MRLQDWVTLDVGHEPCPDCDGRGGNSRRLCPPCAGKGCRQACPGCASWEEMRRTKREQAQEAATRARSVAEEHAAELAAAVADVTDADLALTSPVDGDTYVQVLQARAARATHDPATPALPEWFVRDEDVALVDIPDEQPRPRAPRARPHARPRAVVDVAELERQLAQLEAEHDRLCTPLLSDRAATRLKPATARRVNARMDARLERAVQLDQRIGRLRSRITAARSAASSAGQPARG